MCSKVCHAKCWCLKRCSDGVQWILSEYSSCIQNAHRWTHPGNTPGPFKSMFIWTHQETFFSCSLLVEAKGAFSDHFWNLHSCSSLWYLMIEKFCLQSECICDHFITRLRTREINYMERAYDQIHTISYVYVQYSILNCVIRIICCLNSS